MLKKTVEYEDFDGNKVVEDLYFHLSKAELSEMELSHDGEGLSDYLQKILENMDKAGIVQAYKDLLGKAVGRRHEDGRRFEKSPEITSTFFQTGAYDAVFMELFTDVNAASTFFRAVLPADLREKIEEETARTTVVDLPQPAIETAAVSKKLSDYSDEELLAMDQDEFDRIAGKDPKKWPRNVLVVAFQRKTK